MTRWRASIVLFAAVAVAATPRVRVANADQQDPLLVVLSDSGRVRDGLPVFTRSADEARVSAVLLRGFSGTLLRVYRWEQYNLARSSGKPIEPAYLVLTEHQGGFPRFGFYLDDVLKQDVGYVDLHRSSQLSGRFGAMDQIFPHELLHVIVRQLTGEPPEGGANQVHAVGVRTDPFVAFAEGFAEHAQVMAVDDPDAVPETRALAADEALARAASADVFRYAGERGRLWPPVPLMRMRFPFWFSQREQVLRYHAVKANAFARAPAIPERLLDASDRYDAYLLANILPGGMDGRPKPPRLALSTEGVVSHLFWRLMTDPAIQSVRRDSAFYAEFGAAPDAVSPLENAYLKLFRAMALHHAYDAAGVVEAYATTFADEADAARAVLSGALLGQSWQPAREIWVANGAFLTGTTLFDQFRSAPQVHTFDINAASAIDWLTVPGVSRELAEQLVQGAPYESVSDISRVAGVNANIAATVNAMAKAMGELRAKSADRESSVSIWGLLRPYIVRAVIVWVITSMAAAWLYARVRRRHLAWAIAAGVVSSFLVLAFTWMITGPTWLPPFLVPALVCGAPAALWTLARRRGGGAALGALASWLLCGVPALVATWPF